MPVNLYVEPTQLSGPDGTLLTQKTKIKQGGVVAGHTTVKFEITHLDGIFESYYSTKELREILDILEPVPAKRDRKKKALGPKGQALLNKEVS